MLESKDLKDLQVPKSTSNDVFYTLSEIISSLLPIGGAEMFRMIFTSPLEKRRNKWMEEVSRTLIDLHQKQFIDIDSLAHNEEFVSLAAETTRAALGQHEEEKLKYLKNALINSLLHDLKYDTNFAFIRAVEQITPRHVQVLKYAQASFPEFPSNYFMEDEIIRELGKLYFEGDEDIANVFLDDLCQLKFVEKKALNVGVRKMPTDLPTINYFVYKSWGERFLNFISDPIPRT